MKWTEYYTFCCVHLLSKLVDIYKSKMDVNKEAEDLQSLTKRGKYSISYSKNDLKDALQKVKTNELSIQNASV